MKGITLKTLYAQAERGKQSLCYTEYLEHGSTRWRVRFRSDFYPEQSFGIAERWDGTKWQEVFTCSPSRLKLGGHSTIEDTWTWEADAALDAQYLVGMAALVIGEEAA